MKLCLPELRKFWHSKEAVEVAAAVVLEDFLEVAVEDTLKEVGVEAVAQAKAMEHLSQVPEAQEDIVREVVEVEAVEDIVKEVVEAVEIPAVSMELQAVEVVAVEVAAAVGVLSLASQKRLVW